MLSVDVRESNEELVHCFGKVLAPKRLSSIYLFIFIGKKINKIILILNFDWLEY